MRQVRHLALFPCALGASPAFAHSPLPGIEGFYAGALHPFSTPSQALLMLGLGFSIGSFAVPSARWLLIGFATASLIGLLFGARLAEMDQLYFGAAFTLGTLAALAPGRWLPVAMALVVTGGFLIGNASIPDDGPLRDRLFTMSGSLVGANVAMIYVFGFFDFVRERYRRAWVGIGIRVLSAWLAAVAVVMLALTSVVNPVPS